MGENNLKQELGTVIKVFNEVTYNIIYLWIILQINFKLIEIANLVKSWQMEHIKKNGRMPKKFSDDEDDILSSDDEEQKQAQKYVVICIQMVFMYMYSS